MVVDKQSQRIICTHFCEGKCHDFKLYQSSQVRPVKETEMKMDSGYQGAQHNHENTSLPFKKKKGGTLTSEEKKSNQQLSSQRMLNAR